MANINTYHRPETVEEALQLIAEPGVVPLGGGTTLNGLPEHVPDAVVDLQALGLDRIEYSEGELHVGSTVTLADLAAHEMTPAAIVQLAKREAPNTIRNAATVGGAIGAADPESPLLASLLAYDAGVRVIDASGRRDASLADVISEPRENGRLIESIHFTVSGAAAWEGTARTPADTPIVLVVGRVTPDSSVQLAATGVADAPIVLDPFGIAQLDPPHDFRGSPEYRRHLADVLSRRVVESLR